MSHKWLTDDQLDEIRSFYGTTTASELAQSFGVHRGTVVTAAARLGVASGYGPSQSPAWTERQDRILRDRFGKTSTAELARCLGRTEAAIRTRANELGVKVLRPWTPEEDSVIREWYPVESVNVQSRLIGRSRNAIKHRARSLKVRVAKHE